MLSKEDAAAAAAQVTPKAAAKATKTPPKTTKPKTPGSKFKQSEAPLTDLLDQTLQGAKKTPFLLIYSLPLSDLLSVSL